MLRMLQLLLGLAFAAGVAAQQPTRTYTQAHFIVSEAATPPGEDAAWIPVTLPHRWGDHHPAGKSVMGWYRIRLALSEQPKGTQAINVDHLRSRWVDLYVNDTPSGSSRDTIAGGGLGMGLPLYLSTAPQLLRPGENVLHLRMAVSDPLQGLGRVTFGDARAVRRATTAQQELGFYAQRTFLAMALAAGLITLFVWWARRDDPVLLWFGVACLSWALSGVLWNALRWTSAPPQWLMGMLQIFQTWGLAVPTVVVALRTVGLRWPRFEALLWTFLSLELLHSLAMAQETSQVRRYVLDSANAALLLAGAMLIAARAPRPLRWSYRIEIAALVLMAFCMIFELLRYAGWVDLEAAMYRPYHVPVMLAAIGATIFERHLLAVRALERARLDLEQRVAEKTREIEKFHADREEVMRQQALVHERQRILADMHDSVGASLVSLQRYAESGTVEAKVVAQRTREAMQELCIAVDALEPAEGDLGAVLGNLRYRMQPLVESTGANLAWEVGELPPVEALEPAAVFSIQRILLEAISNALQHSGAKQIRLSAQPDGGNRIEITIADDGAGYDSPGPRTGQGLSTMRARAQKLGAALDIASRRGEGTTVSLTIPCQLAPA
jgi:signal transduction histidine kinase